LLQTLLDQIAKTKDPKAQQRAKNHIFLFQDGDSKLTILNMLTIEEHGDENKIALKLLQKILHGTTLGQVLHSGTLNYLQRFNLIALAQQGQGSREEEAALFRDDIDKGEYTRFLADDKRRILQEALAAEDEVTSLKLLKAGISLDQEFSITDRYNLGEIGEDAASKNVNYVEFLSDKDKELYLKCKSQLASQVQDKESASASAAQNPGADFTPSKKFPRHGAETNQTAGAGATGNLTEEEAERQSPGPQLRRASSISLSDLTDERGSNNLGSTH
jgi:hypothetical protein